MTTPAQAAWQLLKALGVGLPLGLFYSFLRPIRRRNVADLLFAPAFVYAWLLVGFGICGGDLRLGYFAAMALGAFLSIRLPGRWLMPAFRIFWGAWRKVLAWLKAFFRALGEFFWKKTSKIRKNIFPFRKKSGTINKNIRRNPQQPGRRNPHGKHKVQS